VVPLGTLKKVRVPEPSNLRDFVRDRATAIALGKALFWDMQVGSDGIQACATCHFQFGADPRIRNSLSPATGRLDVNWQAWPSTTFPAGKGPNGTLTPSDFPLRKLADINNRSSAVLSDSDNIVSSQGIHKTRYVGLSGGATDNVVVLPDPVFNVGGVNVRQVPNRSTPTVINAVFNQRQFWDGRAQSDFNGVNPWGARDPNARVVQATGPGRLDLVRISLPNSSLASQAVGPPISAAETSATGRAFTDLGVKFTPEGKNAKDNGKRLKVLTPLGRQLVAKDDSVLGPLSAYPSRGLKGDGATYTTLIQKAFQPRWWQSTLRIVVDSAGNVSFRPSSKDESQDEGPGIYTLLDYNFALYFGIAVQMYESTLVSDDSPFDRYMDGKTSALTPVQLRGLAVFNSDIGRCVNCHGGPEFTNAGITATLNKPLFRRVDNLLDTGFNNIGVRPTREDIGLGADDPWGLPLSMAAQVVSGRLPPPSMNPPFDPATDNRPGVDGAFKTPGLRNVELTAPYFHNGGQLTLKGVLDFYSRGGDFQPIERRNGEIFPLRTIALADSDRNAVVEFLRALTDERVRYERAPFDHPELFAPEGHILSTQWVLNDGTGRAVDLFRYVPPVGRGGRMIPPQPFLQ